MPIVAMSVRRRGMALILALSAGIEHHPHFGTPAAALKDNVRNRTRFSVTNVIARSGVMWDRSNK
jgi:hypothetical protein